jgi:hypothetical protein
MKYLHAAVLAAALIASGWAVNAHAAEGYSDPSDLRTPGGAAPKSTWTIKSSDGSGNGQDPFGMRNSGVTMSTSTVTIKSSDGSGNGQDPFGMRAPGVTFVTPGSQLANQPVHRTQPLVHAHAPTVTNASPNG